MARALRSSQGTSAQIPKPTSGTLIVNGATSWIWGGAAKNLPGVLKRFVVFNPGEILFGRYGPLIWILNMSWILTACLFAAGLRLALDRGSRRSFRLKTLSRRPVVFVLLVFAATTYALTRYETFSHARYLLAIVPFFILQFGVGSVIPLLVLTFMLWRGITGKALIGGVAASAFLVLLAVLMMRWNVVIGGQEIAKTGKGLLAYHPMLFGREGMLAAAFVVATPFLLLSIMVRLFPPWPQEPKPA